MRYADIITITPEHLPEYDKKLAMFFEEHIHADAEIRYIIGGSGSALGHEGQGTQLHLVHLFSKLFALQHS